MALLFGIVLAVDAVERGVAHVCILAGTRNHFALDLGMDRDDVLGALDAFGEALERPVDLAEVNGRVFVNNVSLGVYAMLDITAAHLTRDPDVTRFLTPRGQSDG